MPWKPGNTSRFCNSRGILLAADLENETDALAVIDQVAGEIAGVKLGNALLYRTGPSLVSRIKSVFGLPVVVDLKITDVGHIAEQVAGMFAESGADAVTVSGVCGPTVVGNICRTIAPSCEVWLFTEFTDQYGLLDEDDAERATRIGLSVGAVGFQAPGNRPDRVEEMRQLVGPTCTIMSCGMGAQGGKIGAAVSAGANYEIIGRWIYRAPSPIEAARRFREAIEQALHHN